MPARAIRATVGQCPFVATTMAIGWVRRLLNALVWIIAAVYIAIDTDEIEPIRALISSLSNSTPISLPLQRQHVSPLAG